MNRCSSILSAALVALTLTWSVAETAESPVTAEQIAAAKTPADHAAIADAYDKEAARLEALAKEHESMAKSYRAISTGQKSMNATSMSAHCAKLSRTYLEAARENRAMAKEHRAIGTAKPM